ncbi:Zinc transporter ZTP29-like protein [Drosera capensis]
MAFLTLHEMLPLAFDYAGQKQAVKAVFLGMAFMSARLDLIRFAKVTPRYLAGSQDLAGLHMPLQQLRVVPSDEIQQISSLVDG